MTVTVKYDQRAASTEAFALLAEAWNELTIEGLTPEGTGLPPYTPDAEVLYAVGKDGDHVGVLVWETRDNIADVKLFYVEPSSRETGVFTTLFKKLQERVYAQGVARVTTSVTYGTKATNKALASIGAKPVVMTYEVRTA